MKKRKPNSNDVESDDSNEQAATTLSEEPKKETKWKNRERVMVLCSRGASYRARHLLNDIKNLMPHVKPENKIQKNERIINELAELANCSKCLYIENRKHKDLYLWMANVIDGPSMKFLVHNVHTMDELRMSGNCLKASRPLLSFNSKFDERPHFVLIKNMIKQIFATPNHHPRSQPFIDHIFNFSLTDDYKIWFRNFQIVDESLELQEIGPRFVLELIRIFEGSFEGSVLYDNPNYVSPNIVRRNAKVDMSNKYVMKKMAKEGRKEYVKSVSASMIQAEPDVFDTERQLDTKKANVVKRTIEKKKIRKKKKKPYFKASLS